MSEIDFKYLAEKIEENSSKIDALADIVERLAISTADRFNSFETRFDNLESRFDKLETRFDDLEKRFDALTESLEFVKADVHDMKLIIIPFDKKIENHDEELAELSGRVNRLEDKVFVS